MMVPGGKLILSNETFESGSPKWDFIANEPVESLLALQTSVRPEPRPSPEYFANKLLLQAQKDEDELYDYKAEQNQIEYGRVFGGKEPFMLAESEYNLGGIATARKGITTKEGRDMASKKFQRDDSAADTNGDGELSTREKEIADATQKNELVEMNHGGMMSGLMGYDEVSGNPIPVGSHAENVRDDIDAKLSTDEYVLPAHVVKWHGLKHIMDMQSEAEMGLMSMQMDGLIQHADASEAEYEEAEETEEDDLSEEMDIEVATVEVDDLLDEDDEAEELTPKTSKLPGMLKKQKYAFYN